MGATRGKAAGGSRRGRGAKAEGRTDLAELQRRFAAFREGHPSGTRIPDALRGLALAAIDSGTSEAEVRRVSGVTSDQVAQWRMGRAQKRRAFDPGHEGVLDGSVAPLVFPVVDSGGLGMGQTSGVSGDLELRLGGWSICIRQVEG